MSKKQQSSAKGPAAAIAVALLGMSMAVHQLAEPLIMKWEGIATIPYPDPATGGEPWTVCFGHTGPDVIRGKRYTMDECKVLLAQDMAIANKAVNRCLPMPKLPQIEAAMTDAVFNIGPKVVCDSTLRKKALANDWPGACAELKQWRMAAGKVMKGLVNRRADAYKLCYTGEGV